jgi:hypothetical protein
MKRKPRELNEESEYVETKGDVIDSKQGRSLLQMGNSKGPTLPLRWLRRISKSLDCSIDDLELSFYWVKPEGTGFWDSQIVIKFGQREEEP